MKYRRKNKSHCRGVALLIVMVSLALLMAIVTDMGTREIIRFKLAINNRDALQAEALAESGANFAQLILTVQEPLQKYLSNFAKMGIQLPAYTIWEIMPIDSDLLKGITDGSFLPDFGLAGEEQENSQAALESDSKKEKIKTKQEEPKIVDPYGPYEAPKNGYGGFRGRFSVIISDEEKKISLRRWVKLDYPKRKLIADLVFRPLSKPENDILFDGSTGDNKNIGAKQLVGNIYDFISDSEQSVDVSAPASEWGRSVSGDKRSIYDDIQNIKPKSAYLDSLSELRLVPGVTDTIYRFLADYVTIYGESDQRINILSASDKVMGTVFAMCAKEKDTGPFQRVGFEEEIISEWKRKRSENKVELSLDGIMQHLKESQLEVDTELCKNSVGTDSKTFRVESSATVGNVTKTRVLYLRAASSLITIYHAQWLS